MEKPTASRDRPAFPAVEEDVGEDPARFLCMSDSGLDDAPRLATAKCRIEGIRAYQTLRAWRAVARRIDAPDRVFEWLDEREAYLDENGETTNDDLDAVEIPPWEERDDVGIEKPGANFVDRDGGTRSSTFTRSGRIPWRDAGNGGAEG